MKQCFKCKQRKPMDQFYPHSRMADGHLNKCKACTKKDVRRWYEATLPARREYERERFARPERKAQVDAVQKRRREKFPGKYKARQMVGNALRDGRLVRRPCEACGTTERVQAHHNDYRRPLAVRWLCFKHHRELAHGQKVAA